LPPKAAAPLAPKVASPVAPPVVAKPVAPPIRPRLESNAAMSPGGAKVLVAAHVAQPSHADDDAWDEVATKIEAVAPKPPSPAGDVHAIVRAAIDDALGPMGDAFLRLERRILELERRPTTTVAAAPPPLAVAPVTAAAAPMPFGAPAAPAPAASPIAPVAPRPFVPAPRTPDIPIDASPSFDIDTPFDGKRRKRRVMVTFVFLILIGLGTPLGILIASYMR
jgi:hypothetical protein